MWDTHRNWTKLLISYFHKFTILFKNLVIFKNHFDRQFWVAIIRIIKKVNMISRIHKKKQCRRKVWNSGGVHVVIQGLWRKRFCFTESNFLFKKSDGIVKVSSTFSDFQKAYEGEIWYLCTMTFGQKVPKLNCRLVYCSRLYSMWFVILKVRNPLLCTVLRGPLYVIARSLGSRDWPTWLNKSWNC